MKRPGRAGFLATVLLASLTGCFGDDEGGLSPDGPPPDTAPLGPVTFTFDPTPGGDGAIPISHLPYPNDLLLGDDGKIKVTVASLDMPQGDENAIANLATTLGTRHGFGVTTGALFPVEGLADGDAIDPASLASSVKLVELPAGTEVPTRTKVRVGGAAEGGLFVTPTLGNVLKQGTTYAYVISKGVRTTGGVELGAPAALATLLGDGGAASYAPLRTYLAAHPADVVAAAQFTTDRPVDAMVAARAIVQAQTLAPVAIDRVYTGAGLEELMGTPDDNTAPGRGNPGGRAHANIAAVVLGHFTGVDFLSEDPRALGAWVLDESGAPTIKGTEEIPFLLALPTGAPPVGGYPVAVFQHGLNGSRESVLDVAQSVCAGGVALVGIDIPFHGFRFPEAEDTDHNITNAEGPDGLADDAGFNQSLLFFDISGDAAHGIAVFDPNVMSSVLRQTAVDFMTLARVLDDGDWTALTVDLPTFTGIDASRLLLSGESFGSITGALAIALEPRYGAFFLSVGGGGLLFPLLSDSPNYWPIFGSIATSLFGLTDFQVQPDRDPPGTHLPFIVLQSLLESGDPLTYAPLAHAPPEGSAKHVTLIAAQWDESVSNPSTEALAAAIGLPNVPVARSPERADAPRYATFADENPPLSGNLTTDDGAVTGGLIYLDQVSHGVITSIGGDLRWMRPFPPFVALDPQVHVDNPVVALQGLLVHEIQTYYATGTPEITDTFAP